MRRGECSRRTARSWFCYLGVLNADTRSPHKLFRIERRQDLAALCLVSRQRNAAAIPWLYRCVTLDFSMVKDPFRCFNNASELPSRLVQSLALQGLDTSKHDIEFRRLVEVIPLLPNLQRFLLVYRHISTAVHYADCDGVVGNQQS